MPKNFYLFFLCFLFSNLLFAQEKRALTHEDYDAWKSIGERGISDNGLYMAYTVNPQEGDGVLRVESVDKSKTWEIERGYQFSFTHDSKWLLAKIKPLYQETRKARIKKKKPDQMPKDSFVVINLETGELTKWDRIKSFKIPQKGAGWFAYQAEPDTVKKKQVPDSNALAVKALKKIADSIIHQSLDSVKGKIEEKHVVKAAQKAAKEIYKRAKDIPVTSAGADAPFADETGPAGTKGTGLTLVETSSGKNYKFENVESYYFSENANVLLLQTASVKKPAQPAYIIWYDLVSEKPDTLMRGFNDAVKFSFDEAGEQLAFMAERDSNTKADPKIYGLYYYRPGLDSAVERVSHNSVGMQIGTSVSEHSNLRFNKKADKLFFGVAPIPSAKDTSIVDFEQAKLDIWHYNDDYLQPQQLKRLSQTRNESFETVLHLDQQKIVSLGAKDAEMVRWVNEGDADWVLALSNEGMRKSMQWEGRTKYNIYTIDVATGKRTLVGKESLAAASASPSGKYVYWYDPELKNYFVYDIAAKKTRNITEAIKEPLYDVENDIPTYPSPNGLEGWGRDDAFVLVKDVYDIWKVDPTGNKAPVNLTGAYGKKHKISFDYINFDREKRFLEPDETMILEGFNKENKESGFFSKDVSVPGAPLQLSMEKKSFGSVIKAKSAEMYLAQVSDIRNSELYVGNSLQQLKQRTQVSDQVNAFIWPTVELVHWKMLDGKMSEGLLYKPENFDPNKKYPILFYFYERNADGLYSFKTPAPSASIINIPYFVSNGYLVFDPNIYYKEGEPGESAYNSVVSAAQFLSRNKWVDKDKMGIQGQSWGGYQVAYLVTRTNMFAAAGSGAPVANMTSAYGGIRWGSGMNRQFQYEKTQSRIGATLWEKPDLYLKNSPLFQANKINTPLLIMHNDQDGAVPWYQGIELFTALRRLDKKVWLLQYNDEDHNLIQRRNRKDLSRRLSQFFDHYLKGEPAANWIQYGVPAIKKGVDYGFDIGE